MFLHHRGARILALALTALMILAGSCASAERVVATKRTRAYLSPSAGSPSVSVAAGSVLELTGAQGAWIRVTRGGAIAYMPAADAQEIVECNEQLYCAQATPMYKSYGKSAKYGKLPAGTEVSVQALAGDWAWVRCKGRSGFVAKSALTSEKPAGGDSGDSGTIDTGGMAAYVASDGAKVYKSASKSAKSLGKLPINTALSVDAVRGDWALVRMDGRSGFMKLGSLSPVKLEAAQGSSEKPLIQAMDWWTSDIQNIFARGVTATITDVATGISWKEIRKGGTNHADCQPLTAEDTANMKRACGSWSWERRAVIVTIDGAHYAASMNCMPHGGGSVSGNNFDGHHCFHFINSRTSGTDEVDADHQAAIKKALALNSKR